METSLFIKQNRRHSIYKISYIASSFFSGFSILSLYTFLSLKFRHFLPKREFIVRCPKWIWKP